MRTRLLTLTALALFVAVSASAVLDARQATPAPTVVTNTSVWNGVFTAEQAARGQTQYMAHCAECHVPDLSGGEAPALVGDRFWTTWQESTVWALFDRISKNMPFDDDGKLAGTLPRQSYLDVVAYILNSNAFPTGTAELTVESGVGVQIVRREGPSDLPSGTLVQVVGCLAKASGGWRVAMATRPGRAGSVTTASARTVALGDREFALKFVLTSLDRYVGHRVVASGALIGAGGSDGLNVDLVASASPTCQ